MPDDINNPNTRVGAMAPDASTSPVEWGPEIRVDGKRPEWLTMVDRIAVKNDEWRGEVTVGNLTRDSWPNVTSIRLPADHPRYSKAPTTPELDPALWDRMVALVRDIAGQPLECGPVIGRARAIVADLPKPVDPDMIEARKLAIVARGTDGGARYSEGVLAGEHDTDESAGLTIETLAAAIKRGRELAGDKA